MPAAHLKANIYFAILKIIKSNFATAVTRSRCASLSCASIPTNIAEGCGRNSDAELARFLEIAMGSASELEYLLLLTHDLKLLNTADHNDLTHDTTEIKRMLASFIKKLRADG